MKNIIVLVLVLFSFSIEGHAQVDRRSEFVFEGSIPEHKLAFLKQNYNWKAGTKLIINFKTFLSTCPRNQYRVIENDWNDEFYRKLALKNVTNIYISLEDNLLRKLTNSRKDFYEDKDDFFTKTFNLKSGMHCYALMMINEKGLFMLRVGEKTEADIFDFSKILEAEQP